MARQDATHWPTVRVVNSCNNWLDYVVSYGLAHDKFFQFDDTNHAKLAEGTSPLTINVTDYSFLTDEDGAPITTLLGVSILTGGRYVPLTPVDRNDPEYDASTFGQVSGTPTQYDKIQDNIIRLDTIPPATVSAGLKYFFQRAGSYFVATDTTKQPGVNPALHRGFVIASVYDCALTLGLQNLQPISVELEKEKQKLVEYFATRNNDREPRMSVIQQDNQ
ncbi:MAG: hypothetical protein IPO40_24610 [Fibrobacteres bacterium]|nr:hypothetical protein [Fibrobacterota bacterium]